MKEEKTKKKFNKKKLLTFGMLSIFAIALVSAGVIAYYAQVQQNINIESPIDGSLSVTKDFSQDINYPYLVSPIFGGLVSAENLAPFDVDVNVNSVSSPTDDITTSYVGELLLENKDSGWNIIGNDNTKATLKYTVVGEEFGYELEATGLDDVEYVLIYYADQPKRYTNWGGAPALELGRATASDGVLNLEGSKIIDSLPYITDWNAGEDADYCASDGYVHCKGAKIWLVLASDYTETNEELSNWNPTAYLYEIDLIHYFKTVDGNTVIPEGVTMEFNPMYEFGAIEGEYTVTTEIVPTA